ncbi:MFS polyamine transporter [Mycena floridula]|nr:MFS polyamine transporter [Mycena floridula]
MASPEPQSVSSTVIHEGLAVKSLEELQDIGDPRISVSSRPTEIDEKNQGVSQDVEKVESSPCYVEFVEADSRDPSNFSSGRKWAITIHACYATLIAASTSSAYDLGFESMTRDLHCTTFQATLGLSMYAFGFGSFPLLSASFSEEVGRQPLYIVSGTIFLCMYVVIAKASHIQTVIAARFIQGSFGSTWATMVGGTIADIWKPHERGLPMSIFSVAALGGTGVGPLVAGWIEMNPHLQWRWIQWIQMINCAGYLVLLPFIMRETRTSVILARLAKKLRKETGDDRYRARVEDERSSLRTLIWISCTRPIHLLLTEPIVSSFSLWVGFVWGLLFVFIESVGVTFSTLHGFNIGQVGTVFVTMTIGSLIGFAMNLYQERIYQKRFPTKGQEARLYMACFAAILCPISMFIYAWCAYSFVPWYGQAIAIVLFVWACFVIYTAVFTYLADCYGPYASSALAGQSLCRNLAGTAFPLFTDQIYNKLGYRWSNTLFGCIATLMIPIPFVLFFFGPAIRRRSKFSRMVIERQKD